MKHFYRRSLLAVVAIIVPAAVVSIIIPSSAAPPRQGCMYNRVGLTGSCSQIASSGWTTRCSSCNPTAATQCPKGIDSDWLLGGDCVWTGRCTSSYCDTCEPG